MEVLSRHLLAVLLCISTGWNTFSQTPPSIGIKGNDTIIVNTGANYLLIPGIYDNDPGEQTISFATSSSNTDLLSIDSVSYTPGQTFAVMYVREKGTTGIVSVQVEIDDGDSTASDEFDVYIVNYSNPGVNYEVHDVVFWQQVNAFGQSPLWDTILNSANVVTDEINWDNIPLTVSGDCGGQYCDGHDFSTSVMHGFIIPPATGNYIFFQTHQDADALWLSTDGSYDNVRKIISDSEGTGTATGAGNEWQSAPVSLEANQPYAFYSVHWNIHFEDYTLAWEGPGISKQIISGDNLFFVYDTVLPAAPTYLSLFTKGVDEISIYWKSSTDNQHLEGYNLYVDGVIINSSPISDTTYTITALNPETTYSMVVTATDRMGNESLLSNILTVTTYEIDENPPLAPTGLVVTDSSGLALAIAWNSAVDNETEIKGYNVFVDAQQYNQDLIYDTAVIIEGLTPESEYDIYVVSVDVGNNESTPSSVITGRTIKFSVGDNLGVRNGEFSFELDPLSRNAGIGINMPHPYKEEMPGPGMIQKFEDLNVGALRLTWDWDLGDACDRWSAGETHFMGPDIPYSIGDFMDLCNSLDAYTAITVTLQTDGWFVNDPQSFANILEYFAGPAESTWGSQRAAEGYTESLLESSKGLVIEYGNEVWGGNAHCIPLGENLHTYAAWCRDMDMIIKSSPYYDSTKIFTCYSGRNPRQEYSWGQNIPMYSGDSGQVDWIALSGYMGGNFDYDPGIEPAESELGYLKNGIATMLDKIRGILDQHIDMIKMAGEVKPVWFYEGNFTSTTYFGRFGQALVFTDYLATGMEVGLAIPIIYSFDHGQWKIISPSQDDKKLPLFHMASLFNRCCKGDVLRSHFSSINTITDASGNTLDADPVSCHAYHNSGDYSVLLISRDFENDYYVQLNLPDTLTFHNSAAQITITSDHYSSYETEIDTSDLVISDSMMMKVPKGSMVLITFTGTDQDFESLAIGSVPGYARVTDVEIVCEENTNIISEPGQLHFSVIFSPEDAVITDVVWSMEDKDLRGIGFSNGVLTVPEYLTSGIDTVIIRATVDQVSDTYLVIIDLGVGVNETGMEGKVEIYPNPADETIAIECYSFKPSTVYINDIWGRQILIRDIKNSKFQLSLSDLESGIYLMRVQSVEGKVYHQRLIKR